MTESLPVVELPAALARAIGAGHPWVYRDHVPKGFRAHTGAWVRVRCGPLSAVALWDADSPLALRIFSRDRVPDADWIDGRVRDALALRRAAGVVDAASAYRWIGGEGDGIPGIFVDRYAAFAVITADGSAVATIVPWVAEALARSGESRASSRSAVEARERSASSRYGDDHPPRDSAIEENGLRFRANLYEGQKTGLFLDQRDNRSMVERLSGGRDVLNLFGYTGAFSVYAARGGATRVTTVDIAEGAVAAARDNFSLNGFDPDTLRLLRRGRLRVSAGRRRTSRTVRRRRVRSAELRQEPRAPRSRAESVHPAPRCGAGGHRAERALRRVELHDPGRPDAFRGTLADGARKARRTLQIVHDAGHAPDHPVLAGHPEGRYLKFMVARALPVA